MNDIEYSFKKNNNNPKSTCCKPLDKVLVWTCALAECASDTCVHHGCVLWDADWLIKPSITSLLSSSLLTLPAWRSCCNEPHVILTLVALHPTSDTHIHSFLTSELHEQAPLFHLVCDDFASSAGLWHETGQQSSRKDSIVHSQSHKTTATKSRWQPSTKF